MGLFGSVEHAHAQSENRFPTVGVTEGLEEMPWIGPNNITADNNTEATISNYDFDEFEQTLRSHTYGFTIPGTATIDGIELIVGRKNPGGSAVSDNVIRLAKAGVAVGANKSTGVTWPGAEAPITYGSPTDLWGTTWTPAEINAAGFGATLNPLNTGSTQDAEVDYHRIIVYYTDVDVTAPDAVTDLATGTVLSTSVQLTWTAPGDDGATGTATTYDVRYSTSTITAGNWASATQATGEPAPQVAGSAETFTVTGLSPSTTYYFAIKTSDEVPNESGLSNVPTVATAPPDVTPPDDVTDLATSNVRSTSLQLSWTAPGDDGATGTATSYDIRYSTSTITEGNWAAATQVTGEPAPQIAGSSETFTVTGLSGSTTYYFAIKTSDEESNESAISNVPSATTDLDGMTQTGFAWSDDVATFTSKGDDVTLDAAQGTTYVLGIQVAMTQGAASGDWVLQVREDGAGSWLDVFSLGGGESPVWETDNTHTFSKGNGDVVATGEFGNGTAPTYFTAVDGEFSDDNNGITDGYTGPDVYTELQYTVRASGSSDGHTYEFRILYNGAVLDLYNTYATVADPGTPDAVADLATGTLSPRRAYS